jgi:hypothetical protein
MPRRWIIVFLMLFCGCTLIENPVTLEPTFPPVIPTLPVNGAVQTWQTMSPGLEQRTYLPPPENEVTKITALRIDPAYFTFRVHYRPGAPLTIRQWAEALPSAIAFINANFFDENDSVLGLLVAAGQIYGSAYIDRGGTFLVQNGQPRVRSNIVEPYVGEPLEQAIQAFPMLMLDGIQSYNDTTQDRFTRRTIIAQDANGRIVMLVTPLIGLTLLDLSAFLPTTDMKLVNALNLDGGGSTLMYLNASGTPEYIVTSLDPVPAVVAVYPRN